MKQFELSMARLELEYGVVNPNDSNAYNHVYLVTLAVIVSPTLVYADNEQDALDIYADFAQAQGWIGLFLDDETRADLEQYNEVEYLGNNGLPVNSSEVFIKQVR